jgi:hypothetical protein
MVRLRVALGRQEDFIVKVPVAHEEASADVGQPIKVCWRRRDSRAFAVVK